MLELIDHIDFGFAVLILLFHVFCFWTLIRIRPYSPVLSIIQCLVVLDFCDLFMRTVHDYPTQYVQKIIMGEPLISLNVFAQCMRWFGQLILMPLLACVQLSAIMIPAQFRKWDRLFMGKLISIVLLIPLGFTIPFFTNCCGFVYYFYGNYWAYDMTKSEESVRIFTNINIGLQAMCFLWNVLADVYLIRILYKNKRKLKNVRGTFFASPITVTGVSSNGPNRSHPGRKREANLPKLSADFRLAMAFLFFSVGFIVTTVFFNFFIEFSGIEFSILRLFVKIIDYTKVCGYIYAFSCGKTRGCC